MKKYIILLLCVLALSSCSSVAGGEERPSKPWWQIPPFSWFDAHGDGQEIFHWQRPRTNVQKFANDHKFCIARSAQFKLIPAIKKAFNSIAYTEEVRLNIRADWTGKSGIWASFIPYPGAQPLMVNTPSPQDDDDINYQKYVDCMEDRGYTTRTYDIPEATNIYLRGKVSQ
ncbi:MAG: membrane lipoprotein lipid attachment site-containing protein [Alphaproteobacteria bacterium]|nr:membrane lipoprotein lipid attachment site-containing protein [Alphaproteobacteria bacterium]